MAVNHEDDRTIFDIKIDELWNIAKRRNFIERIEIHFVLKVAKIKQKRIHIDIILPHCPTSQLRKKKFLLLVDDKLLKETKNVIKEYSNQLYIEKERKSKILIHQYIENIMDKESFSSFHSLFETNIECLCFDYYCDKQYEIDKMCRNSMNYLGIGYKTFADLKKINKDRKIVKRMFNCADKIFCSYNIIRQIPRLLGPTLSKMEKFPSVIKANQYGNLREILDINRQQISINYRIKSDCKFATISCCIGDINMDKKDVIDNIMGVIYGLLQSVNMKWHLVHTVNVKRTMGKSIRIYSHKDIVSRYEIPKLMKQYKRKLNLY